MNKIENLITEVLERHEKYDISKAYTEEFESTVKKWDKYNYLAGIDNSLILENLVLMLENQRLRNTSTDDNENFKRLSIPLVRKVWSDPIIYDLVNIHTMLNPSMTYKYYKSKETKSKEIAEATTHAKSRIFRTVWRYENQYDVHPAVAKLELEYDLTNDLAKNIRNEIFREVVTDLRNNAGTIAAVGSAKYEITQAIHDTSNHILLKLGYYPGTAWLVTNKKIAKILAPKSDIHLKQEIGYVGEFNEFKLYVDEKLPDNILIGYKNEDPHTNSYHYFPYIPFALSRVVLDQETFLPGQRIIFRYGKRMINANFYGLLKVTGLSDEQEPKFKCTANIEFIDE